MRGYGFGATTPAPVPYEKQTNDFLIGIINKYGARLREIHNRLKLTTLSAKERSDLVAEQKKLVDGYWTPAKTNLEKRGYKVQIDAKQAIIITPPAKTAASPVVLPPKPAPTPIVANSAPAKSGGMTMILLAAAAAGAYWYFVMRKQSPGLAALRS
jgi:hypothetical protein